MDYGWVKSEFVVEYFKDIEPRRRIDTQLFNLEFSKVKLIKGILTTEGNTATENDILLLTTTSINNLSLSKNLFQSEIEDIWNMSRALDLLERSIHLPLSKDIIKHYNSIVTPTFKKIYSGKLRKTNVQISGTFWRPPDFQNLPRIVDNFEKEFNLIDGDINKAFSVLLFISKNQLFIDGNKRTAILSCLHHLAHTGQPLLMMYESPTKEFMEGLKDFYETGVNNIISSILYSNLDNVGGD